MNSYLQYGDYPLVQQRRQQEQTFEQHLKRKNEARMIFLRQDARLRLSRAQHANRRRSQEFSIGQLVYFFRRGRGHGSRYQSLWFEPTKVVCVEKTGDDDRNQTPGSIIWIAHGTTLFLDVLLNICGWLHTKSKI